MMAEREIGRYACRDEDGNGHTVVEIQDILWAATLADPSAVVPGMKRFVLDGGESVIWVDETTFRTPAGKTLWRV
jgi:hypothetical protein